MLRWLSTNITKPSTNPDTIQPEEVTAGPIEIEVQHRVYSVAFLADGKNVISGDNSGMIRRWRVEDGKEEGPRMNAGSGIRSIAVSHDSKWIVCGTDSGMVVVWGTESKKTIELTGHKIAVFAVDVSPDGTRIVTGSDDRTGRVWSLSTGEQLLGPWRHDFLMSAVKFSPDGLLIATATWSRESIRVYDSQHGNVLVDFEISVKSWLNESLTWASNNHLFVLSVDGNVNYLDVSTGTTLSRWPIHGSSDPRCIVLAANGLFVAASDELSISFWDTTTHEQVGPVVHHTSRIETMAISADFDLAVAGGEKLILFGLRHIIPPRYLAVNSELTNSEKPFSVLNGISNIIYVSDTTLRLWRKDRLLEAVDAISREKHVFKNQRHHMLATRALLRARLRQWNLATVDAQKSINIQPNSLAYIALGMARFGRGDVKSGKEAFHWLLFKCNVSEMVSFVFLIKAIIMLTFGYHEEAIVRVDSLIHDCLEHEKASYCAIQAHMHLIAANACIDRQEYIKARKLLRGLKDIQFPNDVKLDCISLMFGWTFDLNAFLWEIRRRQRDYRV